MVYELQDERALMAGFVAIGRQGDRTNPRPVKRRVDGFAASLCSADQGLMA
jgi:hypothetical protein